jgi:hypothetical protein
VAPKAELQIWFSAERLRCRPGVVTHGEKEGELDLRVYTAEKRANGVRVREYTDGAAGQLLWFGGGGGDERQEPDGTWQAGGAWGKSDQSPLGVLSRVDADVARFDGMMVDISASCDGPMREVACPTGGTRSCDTCQNVKLEVKERPMGMLGRSSAGVTLGKCACPDVSNPDLVRANLLFDELEAWTPKAPGAGRVAIYRSAAACKADKPGAKSRP